MKKLPLIRLENNLNSISEVCDVFHNQDVNTDLILMMLGKKLGNGVYRDVYDFNLNPNMVVKIEGRATECNISEYLLWEEIQGLCGNLAWVKEWFAPIYWCSPNGKIIIQHKTEIRRGKVRPDKVPCFLSDIKSDNFGWINNKFVCHDYGFINKFIEYKKKFKKVNWD